MEFLFDDAWIEHRAGVRRVLGAPRREPTPVLRPVSPWESAGCHAFQALRFDAQADRFKMWYRASTGKAPLRPARPGIESSERATGDRRSFLCYAESIDGITWTRPELRLIEFQGNRRNNILRELPEGDSMFYNVVQDPDDPDPGRRYKAIGFDYAGTSAVAGVAPGSRAVCVGYSHDGLRWTAEPHAIMGTADLTDADCLLPHREPVTGKWVGFFRPRTHPKRRFIGYAESDDFERWSFPRMLLTPDASDDEWTEFYGLTVVAVGGWRVGSLWVFHNNPDASPMTQELVYSRDGLHYHRAIPGSPFLPPGPSGSFDSRMISAVAFLEHGGECRLYYNGSNREHGSDRGQSMFPGRVEPGEPQRSGLGLARLPWGHFCGLRADQDGLVASKWLTNYGRAGVQAIGDIADDGWIRTELVDQFGQVIPGWDRAASHVVPTGDGRLRCTWGDDGRLDGRCGQVSQAGGTIGHVVKLRFYLHRATLFGFRAGEAGAIPARAE